MTHLIRVVCNWFNFHYFTAWLFGNDEPNYKRWFNKIRRIEQYQVIRIFSDLLKYCDIQMRYDASMLRMQNGLILHLIFYGKYNKLSDGLIWHFWRYYYSFWAFEILFKGFKQSIATSINCNQQARCLVFEPTICITQ